MFHPQIIDSLLAIKIFLLFFNILRVGSSPAIPGIAVTAISFFFVNKFFSNLLIILVLLFLNFFFTFL